MALVIHSDANIHRQHLFRYGFGYSPNMDWLYVCREARRNRVLTEFYVVVPTPSLAVEFLRHPHEERIIGVKYWDPAHLLVEFGLNGIPRPCSISFFADLIDRWLAKSENGLRSMTEEHGAKVKEAHTKARVYLDLNAEIPESILRRMDGAINEIRAKRMRSLH